jgi:hypothetical protein
MINPHAETVRAGLFKGTREGQAAEEALDKLLDELEYAQEKAGLFSTGVGLARMALKNGKIAEAQDDLDHCNDRIHELTRQTLIKQGYGEESIDQFLGRGRRSQFPQPAMQEIGKSVDSPLPQFRDFDESSKS